MDEPTSTGDLILAWPRPAENWCDAAPIGNGRLGAMVFGGARRARLTINDSTVWSGTPHGPAAALRDVIASGAGPERLARVRDAVLAEDYRPAESLLMSFEGPYSQEFLPLADLWLSFGGEAEYHGRTLNLDDGVIEERFTVTGQHVVRRSWASRPAGAICVAVSVDGTVYTRLELSSPLHVVRRVIGASSLTFGIEIPVDGAPRHEPQVAEPLRYGGGRVDGYDAFGALAVAIDTDGEISVSSTGFTISGMSRLLVTVSTSTAGEDAWATPPGTPLPRSAPRAEHLDRATARAATALAQGAAELLLAHDADLRALLATTSLTVGDRRGGLVDVATEVLSGKDEQLTATVIFQFGRYLLASSSRQHSGPPANLQGLWNADLRPAWSSNYTININTQMNYWGAEPAGLSDCHGPLFDLLDRLAVTGGAVAGELYGARGWVTHHNTDMWGWALPVGMGHGNPSWAIWMMGGAWLVQHVWDHYEFTQDTEFLAERAWPLLRGCSLFCLDWLVEGRDGWLETVPSTSPENLFISRQGTSESLTYSTTMDIALIRAVFTNTLCAAEILGRGDPVCAEIAIALPRLRPPRISADGRLAEWVVDHVEHDPLHRHMSPMVALYPLNQIDAEDTPELAAAARRLLDRRGPGAMGWSWSWKIALRARLGDGDTARDLLEEATRPFAGDPTLDAPVDGSEWGGLLPNLFSTHPPCQLDGNYGLMAGIAELLAHSHGGVVRVLPALPTAWPTGSVRGLRCRGGLAVDIDWHDGELAALTVLRLAGPAGRRVTIGCRDRKVTTKVGIGERVHFGPGLSPC
ncbi:MAG TPA: glycoside hydrolase N-terminal domain-containing protein [Pseudonocardiaceae bacterium]|jgi:alpha-L-fucosidase 2|nr:glycoside hydrolase N-terminal domain-containing protein [Pseudonocardiaceae bacterium]